MRPERRLSCKKVLVATVHLICGSTGAGKTTYAKALATRTHAVRLSIEDWMAMLFWADAVYLPAGPTLDWVLARTTRCERQMWALTEQLVARGLDVVFDMGLPRRNHRDELRLRALQLGAEVKLHYLDVDRETRRERVLRRHSERSGAAEMPTETFPISEAMFEVLETHFEAPSDDELYNAMIVCESEEPGEAMLG